MGGTGFILRAASTMLRRPRARPNLPVIGIEGEAVVEAGPMAAYAAVCGFTAAQGVPVTYPHILSFPLQMRLMLGRGFPFPLPGLVHLQNRIVQHAGIATGDRLGFKVRASRLVEHPRGQAFVISTMAGRDGEMIWGEESLYLHRQPLPGEGEPAPVLADMEADRLDEAWDAPADIGRRYARVSGDPNPIHTNALMARLLGFPRPIAHGMWSLARAAAALSPQAALASAVLEGSFRAPLLLPGRVRLWVQSSDFELIAPESGRSCLRGRLTIGAAPDV